MKNGYLIFLTTFLLFGCKSKNEKTTALVTQNTFEILFEVKTNDAEDLEVFEDGIIPWISIKDPEPAFKNLIGKNDIVIHKQDAILVIDYPLNKPVTLKITANDANGFTRKELVRKISEAYNRIYQEEEASAEVKTIPLEERQGLINRNQTNGKYGIWGHDIDDLDLSAVVVEKGANGEVKLLLFVES